MLAPMANAPPPRRARLAGLALVLALEAALAVRRARSRRGARQARAQTEEARRAADAARERLDVVLGALAEAVTVHDERGKTIYANDAAVRLLGARRSTSSSRRRPARSPRASR